MIKISHFNSETGVYNAETARFYHGEELILEIDDAYTGYCVGELASIAGNEYLIICIMNYPETLVVDYFLQFKNRMSRMMDI